MAMKQWEHGFLWAKLLQDSKEDLQMEEPTT
jgi:hypothetical protein